MMRDVGIQLSTTLIAALCFAAGSIWLGLEPGWMVALPTTIFAVGLAGALGRLWWTLGVSKKRSAEEFRFLVFLITNFFPLLENVREKNQEVEKRLQSCPGSFPRVEQNECQAVFNSALTYLGITMSQLCSTDCVPESFGVFMKEPIGDSEVVIVAADHQSARKPNLAPGCKHANSAARRKLGANSNLERWSACDLVVPIDVSAREGLVAGSILERQLLCLTCSESGPISYLYRHHEDLLRAFLPFACSQLFREFDRFSTLCNLSDTSAPYAQHSGIHDRQCRDIYRG